ncbi:MAG: ribulose-phosphate 3-epimerase [Candidatus Omnitrophota bacterium]
MKKIVPALLTQNRQDLTNMIEGCALFTDYVQIDVMDGLFVPSTSVGIDDIKSLTCHIGNEAHLMVQNPLAWLEAFNQIGSTRIIFHAEIAGDCEKIIQEIRSAHLEVGIAINPLTPVERIEFLLDKVDTVLFMSVHPGFYGAPFIPEVLEKIIFFKQKYPDILTGLDGGVKLDNVARVALSGVDYICVGSAILKARNPQEAYQNILRVAS